MKRFAPIIFILFLSLFISNSCSKNEPEPIKYSLSVTASEGGKVSTQGGQQIEGSTITITATPDDGFVFVKWSNGSTNNPIKITINSNTSIEAIFTRATYSASIRGAVAKGAYVAGSDISFYELDESLNQTGKSYSTNTTDDLGNFTLDIQSLTEEFARVQGDGYYWNEITNGVTTDKLRLNALSNVKEAINVNILTHLEYDRVIELVKTQGKSFADAKTQAVDEVLSSLGIEITESHGNAESYNFKDGNEASKILLVASGVILANKTQNEVSTLIAKTANDIKDNGNIDDSEIKNEIAKNLYTININQMATNVFERYKESNTNLSVESFSSNYLAIVKSEFIQFIPDADGDGVTDPIDLCPDTSPNETANENGCGITQQYFELDTNTVGLGSITEEVIQTEKSSHIYGTKIKLLANPVVNWQFAGWSGDIESSDNPIEVTLDKHLTITATFERVPHYVNVDVIGEGTVNESVVSEASVESPKIVQLTATPADGLEFVKWSGDIISTDNPLQITLDKDYNINALFADPNLDTDGDGVKDSIDLCPDTPSGTKVNEYGCHDIIYFDENGITLKAKEITKNGDTWDINGTTYTVVDETHLRQMIENDEDVTRVVTTKISNMSQLFKDKAEFNQDISSWDTSNVTDMTSMFEFANKFNQPIGKWDVSKVTSFKNMFSYQMETGIIGSFNQDISLWDTSSAVDMSGMFRSCKPFNQPIGSWDVSKVTNMSDMFILAQDFNQNLNDWKVSSVTNMSGMFGGDGYYNQPLDKWDVSNVTNMKSMFYGAVGFNQDIGGWNVSNVTDMNAMFKETTSFNQNLSKWCVTKLESAPNEFSDQSALSEENTPKWGTCPLEDDIDNDGVVNYYDQCNETPAGTNVDEHGCQIAPIYLDENGVTIKARDFAKVGDSWELNGKVYTVVDLATLRQMVEENKDVTKVVTTKINDLNYLFYRKQDFNQDISSWDTSNVTDMRAVFQSATLFDQDISKWNTSKVTSMFGMLGGLKNFNRDISSWDTSKVTNMAQMFDRCESFNQDISSWDVSNVTDMSYMFSNTKTFNISLNKWDTSSVTNFSNMFNKAEAFNGDISSWNISSANDMSSMLLNATMFNQDLSNWCITNVSSEPQDFALNSNLSLEHYPIWGQCGEIYLDENGVTIKAKDNAVVGNSYKISNGGDSYLVVDETTLRQMISDDKDVTHVITSLVTKMNSLFRENNTFNQDISSWDTSNVTTFREMFFKATIFNQNISKWNTSKVNDMYYMFLDTFNFNQEIGLWDVSNVVNMGGMFSGTQSFNGDIGNWNVSNVVNMAGMFSNTTSFNQDIGKWNTGSVINMGDMFHNSIFNFPIGNWNVSKVTDMSTMFWYAQYNQPLGDWDVSKVTTMKGMFDKAANFNQNINTWDVSNVVDMSIMFAYSKMNYPLDKWNVSNVSNMNGMFMYNQSFNQDLTMWCVTKIETPAQSFNEYGILDNSYLPIWGTCPNTGHDSGGSGGKGN